MDSCMFYMPNTPYGHRGTQIPETQPESSTKGRLQRRIRGMIKDMEGVIQIKDNIVIHGKGKAHDRTLKELLDRLQKKS